MKLEDAIVHCEEVTKKQYQKGYECMKCGDEHKQLSIWLSALLSTRNIIDDYDAGNITAEEALALIEFFTNAGNMER